MGSMGSMVHSNRESLILSGTSKAVSLESQTRLPPEKMATSIGEVSGGPRILKPFRILRNMYISQKKGWM